MISRESRSKLGIIIKSGNISVSRAKLLVNQYLLPDLGNLTFLDLVILPTVTQFKIKVGMLSSQIWEYTFAILGIFPRFQNYSQSRPWYVTDDHKLTGDT